MSAVLRAIIAETGRDRPSDPDFVLQTYISHPDRVACTVAVQDTDDIVGFQSLRRATPGNPYGTPPGWGIIGTHVAPWAGRMGVGTALFAVTQEAAREAGIACIDAAIGEMNVRGLAYYEAKGFRTYRTDGGLVRKVYEVSTPSPRRPARRTVTGVENLLLRPFRTARRGAPRRPRRRRAPDSPRKRR